MKFIPKVQAELSVFSILNRYFVFGFKILPPAIFPSAGTTLLPAPVNGKNFDDFFTPNNEPVIVGVENIEIVVALFDAKFKFTGVSAVPSAVVVGAS